MNPKELFDEAERQIKKDPGEWCPKREDPQCPKCGLTLAPVMMYVCNRAGCPTGLGGVMC